MITVRICFVCQSLDTLGGLQRAVVLLANELTERGEDVFVLMDSPLLNDNPYGLSAGVRVLDVGIAGPSKPFGDFISRFRRHYGFPRPVSHERGLSGSIIDKRGLARINATLVGERFDVVVGCDPLHTVIATTACRDLGSVVCGWQHSTYDGYFNQRGRGFYGLDGLFSRALESCDVNFVLTERSKDVYGRKTGYDATVLPNSIANMGARSVAENCVLYCGRLDPGSKGADYIPRIAEGLAAAGFGGRFLVVGDGPYRVSLENWLAGVSLPFEIELKGFVSDAERYYEQAAVLVSPSRWEGFGLSILEAMSHGVPCVAFDNDGPRSLISDGVDGIIVTNGDVGMLIEGTVALIGDGKRRKKMADAAVETARGYLVGTQADRFLAALKG